MTPVQTNRSNRIFVDSSVLIAAAISSKGAARDLIRHGFRGEVDLYVSSMVFEESERNLTLKAPDALGDFCIFRDLLIAHLVEPPLSLVLSTVSVVASKDAPIVAAAIAAKAAYLVTYDRKHLLSQRQEIEVQFGLNVTTPDQVLKNIALK